MPSDVVVSCAREDRAAVVSLAEELRDSGWSVWLDDQIRGGDPFHGSIDAALRSASCVVVVWSKHSVGSTWVRAKAAVGLDRNVLVPVVIEECDIPLPFRQIHTVPLSLPLPVAPTVELSRFLEAVAVKLVMAESTSTGEVRGPSTGPTFDCIDADDNFPDGIEAVVLEEDTHLVVSAERIAQPVDLATTAQAARTAEGAERRLGEVIVRQGSPRRLLAVVHDLAAEPSCNRETVEQATAAAVGHLARLGVARVAFQVLGCMHGRISDAAFVDSLTSALDAEMGSIRHVCIQVPKRLRCSDVLAALRS